MVSSRLYCKGHPKNLLSLTNPVGYSTINAVYLSKNNNFTEIKIYLSTSVWVLSLCIKIGTSRRSKPEIGEESWRPIVAIQSIIWVPDKLF